MKKNKLMTTKEAYSKLIFDHAELINIQPVELAVLRWRFKNGKTSEKKMKNMLLDAGAKQIPELWNVVKAFEENNKKA